MSAPASTGLASTGLASTGLASTGSTSTGPLDSNSFGPGGSWRRWRGPIGIVLVILLGGTLIALLQQSGRAPGYLDPKDPGQFGTRALAEILAHRGEPVTRVDTVDSAAAAAAAQGGGVTLVVTSPDLLTAGQLDRLAAVHGNLLLVEPVSASLTALAPGVTVAGHAEVRTAAPTCSLGAVRLAANADMGNVLLRSTAPGAWQCYPVDGHPSLVRFRTTATQTTATQTTATQTTGTQTTGTQTTGRRTITVLGTGTPLTNQYLARNGNAALALNLLSGSSRVIWLVPRTTPAGPPAGSPAGPQSLLGLIPWPADLVAIQLAIAVALAALWRARRLGPLVAEPLPVIVRASETVEGHGRLYRSRRSRDRASAVLRDAALDRITTRLALPRRADADAVCAAIAARTGREASEIRATLFGPVPRDDAALVALARDIDSLEGKVRTP